MNTSLLCSWLATILAGCGTGSSEPSRLIAKDSMLVQLGFPVRSDLATIWHDPRADSEYFVFADPTTKKRISFLTLQGHPYLTIALDSALDQLNDVDAMCVLSTDSIWLMPAHQNRLILINSSGKVVRRVLLDPCSTTIDGERFEFSASAQAHFCYRGRFVLSSYFKGNINDTALDQFAQPRLDYMRSFYSTVNAKPRLAMIEMDDGGPCTAQLGIDSFYYYISKEPFHSLEANHYVLKGDSVLIFSAYSNVISIADIRELKIRRTVTINSAYTTVNIAPPVLDQKEADSGSKNLNHRFATEGYIQNLVRDEKTGQFVLAVYHKVPWESPPERTKANRPFSLIVLDSSMTEQVHEYLFDEIRYDGFCILPTRSGFYMKRHEDEQAKAGGTHTFDLFALDEP